MIKPSGEQQQDQINALINTHGDYHTAPAKLRAEIASLANKSQKTKNAFSLTWFMPRFTQIGSGFAIGALVATLFTSQALSGQAEQQAMYLTLIADHSRAMVTESTMEVQSSNMHTVKPWLSSKLGYSPQILDLAEQGFTLEGGRRGFVGNSTVAVAVYRYKQHEIDVYILTDEVKQRLPNTLLARNGFNVSNWQYGDLHYIAVSDMNAKVLNSFSSLLASKQASL